MLKLLGFIIFGLLLVQGDGALGIELEDFEIWDINLRRWKRGLIWREFDVRLRALILLRGKVVV